MIGAQLDIRIVKRYGPRRTGTLRPRYVERQGAGAEYGAGKRLSDPDVDGRRIASYRVQGSGLIRGEAVGRELGAR